MIRWLFDQKIDSQFKKKIINLWNCEIGSIPQPNYGLGLEFFFVLSVSRAGAGALAETWRP